MFPTLISIDTEYSSGLFENGLARSCDENFDRCVRCVTNEGEAGIFYQMDVFERHGLKGSFFVDPMPALVWGPDAVERIVKPILDRGHEVQLHLHTEWLALAKTNPLGDKVGQHIKHFSFEDQVTLLEYALEQFAAAGVPTPVAFRAGNYGANDDTLRALAQLGIAMDTSHPPGIAASDCEVSLKSEDFLPVMHEGVLEVPIGLISAGKGGFRHAQITALSKQELTAGVRHAQQAGWPAFVIVSHSFELANRKRQIANGVVKRRFEAFCEWLGGQDDCSTGTFAALDRADLLAPRKGATTLPHNPVRTIWRMGEQAVANAVYG